MANRGGKAVILGPGLVGRQAADAGRGAWVVRRAESRDGELTKKSVTDAQFERLTRNTYKVLLTRGMVGTLIYSTDEETREFLRSLVCATSGQMINF